MLDEIEEPTFQINPELEPPYKLQSYKLNHLKGKPFWLSSNKKKIKDHLYFKNSNEFNQNSPLI